MAATENNTTSSAPEIWLSLPREAGTGMERPRLQQCTTFRSRGQMMKTIGINLKATGRSAWNGLPGANRIASLSAISPVGSRPGASEPDVNLSFLIWLPYPYRLVSPPPPSGRRGPIATAWWQLMNLHAPNGR